MPTHRKVQEKRTLRRAIVVTFIMCLLVVPLGATANAAGSDSATPYTVTKDGIQLPAGDTFRDNGHVNIKSDSPHRDLHFEGKCVDRTDAECAGDRHADAQYIGKNFIPWSAFGLKKPFCVTWVQISHYKEHFGEGGQPPVCVSDATPEVVISPSASVQVLCNGTGTATLNNSESTTSVGFEVVVNGVATLYSVAAGTVETKTLSGAQPGSQVIVQDGEANKLTSAIVPEKCGTPKPSKPVPIVTEASSTSYECGDDFQTINRTVTTTDWVFEEKTWAWVKAEPVTESFTETVAVDVVPCATPPAKPTPPVSDTSKVTSPAKGVLPSTGGPELALGLLGGSLMVIGFGLLVARRRMT